MRHVIISLLIVILVNCSGGRAAIKLEKAQVPVSMSPFLYSEDGRVLAKNKDLKVLGKFEYEKRFWGILWTLIRLSDDDEVSEAINEQVKAKGGDGIVSLFVESDYCGINAVPFLGILPIWPGCTKAKFQGDIVVADIKSTTTQLSETKKEDLTQSETQPNEKIKPEIKAEETFLLDEDPADKPVSAKQPDKTVNQKKKNKGAKK